MPLVRADSIAFGCSGTERRDMAMSRRCHSSGPGVDNFTRKLLFFVPCLGGKLSKHLSPSPCLDLVNLVTALRRAAKRRRGPQSRHPSIRGGIRAILQRAFGSFLIARTVVCFCPARTKEPSFPELRFIFGGSEHAGSGQAEES